MRTVDTFLPRKSWNLALAGVAVTWYANLEPSRVHSGKDLMVAFVRQYQYNSNMALDRMQLQNMCKKGARIFQRIRPKMERLGNSSSAPNNRERDYHNDSRHVTGVLL